MRDRENYIVALYNQGREEVGNALVQQERRLSEMSEDFAKRAEQQQIMDQSVLRFSKKEIGRIASVSKC